LEPDFELRAPEPIREAHQTTAFNCGNPALNLFLQRFALTNHRQGAARTYVMCRALQVVGYYSLSAANAELEQVPTRVSHGLARHPVPLVLLARLAVDQTGHGLGWGTLLLQDAFHRYLQAQEILGCRALVTHAKDERAAGFYRKFGFQPSPLSPHHLYLLTKDILRNLS